MRTGIFWLGVGVFIIGLIVSGLGVYYFKEAYSQATGVVLTVLGIIGAIAGWAMKKKP